MASPFVGCQLHSDSKETGPRLQPVTRTRGVSGLWRSRDPGPAILWLASQEAARRAPSRIAVLRQTEEQTQLPRKEAPEALAKQQGGTRAGICPRHSPAGARMPRGHEGTAREVSEEDRTFPPPTEGARRTQKQTRAASVLLWVLTQFQGYELIGRGKKKKSEKLFTTCDIY